MVLNQLLDLTLFTLPFLRFEDIYHCIKTFKGMRIILYQLKLGIDLLSNNKEMINKTWFIEV